MSQSSLATLGMTHNLGYTRDDTPTLATLGMTHNLVIPSASEGSLLLRYFGAPLVGLNFCTRLALSTSPV